jgi:hypothetical protein
MQTPKLMKNTSVQQPTLYGTATLSLSSRPERRDLRCASTPPRFQGKPYRIHSLWNRYPFLVIPTGGVIGLRPIKVMKNASVRHPLSMEPLPFSLSSRPELS